MNAGLLPVKNPARAKKRLAGALEARAHRELTGALLDDAFAFCAGTTGVQWWVISDDDEVGSRARSEGFQTINDDGRGLNEALRLGVDVVRGEGAQSVLVIPADVPLAQPEDADDILDTGAFSEVVVVPSSDGGTNGLYFDLPTGFEPRFGSESLAAHVAQAQTLEVRCSILDLPRLAVDLDTEEDARALLESAEGWGRTMNVLTKLYA